MLKFSAVLQGAFRFAVFPKRLITFNPMPYVRLRGRKEDADIFCGEEAEAVSRPTITHGQYLKPVSYTHLDVYKRQVFKGLQLFCFSVSHFAKS